MLVSASLCKATCSPGVSKRKVMPAGANLEAPPVPSRLSCRGTAKEEPADTADSNFISSHSTTTTTITTKSSTLTTNNREKVDDSDAISTTSPMINNLFKLVWVELDQASQQLEATSTNMASTTQADTRQASFAELFARQMARVATCLEQEEHHLERNAKKLSLSLLRNHHDESPALLEEETTTTDHHGIEQEARSICLQRKADHIAQAFIQYQELVQQTYTTLMKIAAQADILFGCTNGTTATKVLQDTILQFTPWNKEPNSTIAILLSDIYQAIRTADEKNTDATTKKWEAPSSFQRATTKYWVQDNKLLELLLTCTKEVPLLTYGHSGRLTSQEDLERDTKMEHDQLWKTFASPISSVYFDSPAMSLYKERIVRKESAQLFRVRWYGTKPPQGDETVFLELKTHHEKWINSPSIKERVTIQEKHMTTLLEHKPLSLNTAKSIVLEANPKLQNKPDELHKAVDLLLRMHHLVVKQNLRPCVRSVYKRAAFQSPTTNALRLTVDKDITMIDETNTPNGSWCLSDDAIDSSKVKQVPYPVFEIKLSGSEMPSSMLDLISSSVIVESAKFSKFLTGAAAFNSSKIHTLPYWAEHPAFRNMFMPSAATEGNSNSTPPNKMFSMIESGSSVTYAAKTNENETLATQPQRWFKRVQDRFSSKKPHSIAPQRPARVEPKSYFANERTFIQWTSASLWLLTVAALLVEDEVSGASYLTGAGIALSIGAVFVLIHGVFVYFRRIKLMQTGTPTGYIDRVGPLVLFTAVLVGIVVLLFNKSKSSFSSWYVQQPHFLKHQQGQCHQHFIAGISLLEYQPSDVVFDNQHDMLLVPSLDRIIGHSLLTNQATNVTILGTIPGADLEGIAIAGDSGRIFALSEASRGRQFSNADASLFELAWNDDQLGVITRYNIGDPDLVGEGLAYVPGSNNNGGYGTLVVDQGEGILSFFDVPPPRDISMIQPEQTVEQLSASGGLNRRLLTEGLDNGNIASLFVFEGLLYVLHDNDLLVRSWNLETGTMVSEFPLPRVEGASGRQWEGLSIQHNDGQLAPLAADSPGMLRGSAHSDSQSSLILNLALDTPPQIWSIAVHNGGIPGHIHYPSCAGV